MIRALAVILIGISALQACGGSDDTERVLVMPGGSFTESQFRTDIRSFLVGVDSEQLCNSLDGLSSAEISAALSDFNRDAGVPTMQSGNPADTERAGAIVKEECERITS